MHFQAPRSTGRSRRRAREDERSAQADECPRREGTSYGWTAINCRWAFDWELKALLKLSVVTYMVDRLCLGS